MGLTECLNPSPKSQAEALLMQPVALAFLGDTLFDLYLRNRLIMGEPMSPHEMHKEASSFACASSQAMMAQRILDELTETERSVLKRARNQRSISPPKNADPVDYKWATGFEALLGFLFVCGREERLYEVMARAVELISSGSETVSSPKEENKK